eukprot:4676086-Amphidinium_carterae.1
MQRKLHGIVDSARSKRSDICPGRDGRGPSFERMLRESIVFENPFVLALLQLTNLWSRSHV